MNVVAGGVAAVVVESAVSENPDLKIIKKRLHSLEKCFIVPLAALVKKAN